MMSENQIKTKSSGLIRKNWITENLGLKVISVLLAGFLWYLVNFTGSSEVAVEVPITFEGIPANHELLWESSKTATVWLAGRERIIRGIVPDMVTAVLDLSHSKAGESFYPLNISNLRLPHHVSAIKVYPTVIRVLLEEIISKKLRVVPKLAGHPANGFVIDSVDIIPETIIAEGVKRFLEDEKDVVTKLVNIEGISRDTKVETKLDMKGMGYRIDSDTVTLTIKLRHKEE